MKKIRIGNTIDIRWEVFIGDGDDATPYDLTGKNLTVYLSNAFERVNIDKFSTNENVLNFTWEGKDQRYAGVYQMILIENNGEPEMKTLDERDAFELVRCSCLEDEEESDNRDNIELSSRLNLLRIFPIIPEVGDNGNWIVNGKDTGKPSKGEDAYQIAVASGFKGTYDEYVELCGSIGEGVISQDISKIIIMQKSEYDPEADYGTALVGLTEE